MPPSSLGNGLVHDSRLSLSERVNTINANNADLATGMPWSGFVENFNSMGRVGFRPAQVRSKIEVIATGTDTSRLEVIDQSVYFAGIVPWTGECNEDIPPFEIDTGGVPAIGCCCDD